MSELERERHKNLGLERARDSWYREWFKLETRRAELEAENERLLDRITQLRQYRDQMLDLTHRAEQAEAERDKWADSFRQAEAALEGFLGPDGLSPYERERDAALAERRKWEWVARDACRELAYETHVNPQSPLDYRLAQWRTRKGGE